MTPYTSVARILHTEKGVIIEIDNWFIVMKRFTMLADEDQPMLNNSKLLAEMK